MGYSSTPCSEIPCSLFFSLGDTVSSLSKLASLLSTYWHIFLLNMLALGTKTPITYLLETLITFFLSKLLGHFGLVHSLSLTSIMEYIILVFYLFLFYVLPQVLHFILFCVKSCIESQLTSMEFLMKYSNMR